MFRRKRKATDFGDEIESHIQLSGSVTLLRRMSVWQPFPGAPIRLPLNPDARIYGVALALALVSGFLFGIVPVR